MAEVIVLSDDDTTPPGSVTKARERAQVPGSQTLKNGRTVGMRCFPCDRVKPSGTRNGDSVASPRACTDDSQCFAVADSEDSVEEIEVHESSTSQNLRRPSDRPASSPCPWPNRDPVREETVVVKRRATDADSAPPAKRRYASALSDGRAGASREPVAENGHVSPRRLVTSAAVKTAEGLSGEDRVAATAVRAAVGSTATSPCQDRVRVSAVESPQASPGQDVAAPDSCEQQLDELCAVLRPLLFGAETRIVDRLRRRHAAVLALSPRGSSHRQRLLDASQRCAERLRKEPGSHFTVVRVFFEQLNQIKLAAASVCSLTTAAAPATDEKAGADGAPAAPAADHAEQQEKEARRHRRHVAKLEKTLRRLEREIARQEEQDVDWDDDAGSAYLVGARLKRRYVQVYEYYCRIVDAAEEAERLGARRIHFSGTRYPEINRRIEKFVNRTREFPDFKDVLGLIEKANQRDGLRLGPGAVHDQAKNAFEVLGTQLQQRRRAALAESMDALCGADAWRCEDPADDDPSLGRRLAESAECGQKRLNEVLSEFVERQESAADERRRRRAAGGVSEDQDDDDEAEEEDEEEEEEEVTDDEQGALPAEGLGGGGGGGGGGSSSSSGGSGASDDEPDRSDAEDREEPGPADEQETESSTSQETEPSA